MKLERFRPVHVNWKPLRIASSLCDRGLCGLFRVTLKGRSEASGRVVVIDPNKCRVKLFVEGGKTLRRIVAENDRQTFFACNGQTDNLWSTSAVAVAEGLIIKRRAADLPPASWQPLNDCCSFLTFDHRASRLQHIYFSEGKPTTGPTFMNGIAGPLIIHDQERVDHLIKQAGPIVGPGELFWDPRTRRAAMSAAGANTRGDLIFVSLAGDPKLGNECLLDDVANLLWEFQTVNAILLGVGDETQQYVRSPANASSDAPPDDPWLVSQTELPLANAIVVQEI